MNYIEEIVTNKKLSADVLCYWHMSGNIASQVGVISRHLPKGQNLLVFNFGDNVEILNSSSDFLINFPFFIVPAYKSSIIIKQKGVIDLFGISFIAEGLYKLLEIPMTELKVDFPKSLAEIYESLYFDMKHSNFQERIKLAELFLQKHLNQSISNPHFQKALQLINNTKGAIKVSEIANLINTSERQLQRLFKSRIGISPKNYCKITRVNSYIEYILNKGKSVDWMELVVRYNYHDQPHLINEVKAIAKLSPRDLLEYRDTLYHRYNLF